ncbi:ATPase, T2SS/T4P/T4SS family [Candidatus Alkanophaga liquidiphilum]
MQLKEVKCEMSKKICMDTSALIHCEPENVVKDASEIIVPYAAFDELQAQASKGREEGFEGLRSVKRLRELCEERGVPLRFAGKRPNFDEIRLASSGRLDALIIGVAKSEGATLMTCDYVQSLVAEAEGVESIYVPVEIIGEKFSFERFFTDDTMSVHLKEGVPPLAKRGKVGRFKLLQIREEPCTEEELLQIIKEINEAIRMRREAFIEESIPGGRVVQLGEFRIAIARPPLADATEITIVHPIVKLSLRDYKLSEKLMKRFEERAEGVLIAGPPGSGKTTFASSLANFYASKGKVVKTLELPRDLQVGPEITQYSAPRGDFSSIADILLLVRPDYTVFDEIRKTSDFRIFADMRLAGVGMIGVVHAANPIDAVQRFVGRLDLGMIPSVIDTIIYVKDGEIKKVYEVSMTVKVPTGMTEADLARPVVEIRDFETGKLEYEIYTYGEENVVIPVRNVTTQTPIEKLAAERVLQAIRRYDGQAEVEIVGNKAVVRVHPDAIARFIGRDGRNVSKLEAELGISIDVEARSIEAEATKEAAGVEIPFSVSETKNYLTLNLEDDVSGRNVEIYIDNEFLFSPVVGKKNRIRVGKNSKIGKELLNTLKHGGQIRILRS